MKPHTLPVKRRPVTKGMFKRLSAVTGTRKQRVAATASTEMDIEDGGSKVSRALTIIFLIHVVAIGLIFVHQRFLDGRISSEPEGVKSSSEKKPVLVSSAQRRTGLPQLSSGDVGYMPKPGDNYAKIAAAAGVDEGELRMMNENVEIRPSIVLRIPKRIVAQDPPEVVEIRQQEAQTRAADDSGLVEALPVDVRDAPRAQLVPQQPAPAIAAAPPAAKKSYVVQSGDSVWRIANRFGIKQDDLMKANGISDARKMKTGMNLVIPH
jgi:LysM repeat protein